MARTPGTKNPDTGSGFEPTIEIERPNATVELETSDLKEMALAGVAVAKVNATIALEQQDLVEVKPGETRMVERVEPSIIIEPDPPARTQADDVVVDMGPSVVVDPAASAGTPLGVKRISAVRPRLHDVVEPEPQRSGAWLVVLVYVVATAALAFAIYERFVA